MAVLDFKKINEHSDLVSKVTYDYINENFSQEEKEEFLVAEIELEYMDGVKLC